MLALISLVGVTWALSAPDQALYFAQELAWDGSLAFWIIGSTLSARTPMRHPLFTSGKTSRRSSSRVSSTGMGAI